MCVVLGWVCQIWTKFSEAQFRQVSLNGLHDLHDVSFLGFYGSQIIVVVKRQCSKLAEKHQSFITNRLQETLTFSQYTRNDENIKNFGKAPYWLWQMTFLSFCILSVFLASSCIFLQIKKYMRWRNIKIFLQNGSATRKSQIGWPLTFYLKEQYAASFYRSRFKYGIWSLTTQHFHSYCSSKKVLFMARSEQGLTEMTSREH